MQIRVNKRGFKRRHKPAIAAAVLGALVSFQAGAVRADDTSTEIRLLKQRLKQLEERVAEQGRKEKETQAQLRHAAAQPGPAPGAYTYPVGIGLPPPIGSALAERLAHTPGYSYIGAPSSTLYLGGISITPGGFFELATVTRDHFIGADIATPFGNIPFANVPSSHTDEFRFSARRSRFAVLVMGDVDPATHLAGYGEFDFLGAAQTANSNESDSFNLRQRQIYLTVDQDDFGAHLLAGQAWTLATMNLKGIVPRTENTPLVIDDQYVPGFVWSRQPQIRVTKDFDQNLWFALSAENPQTTFGSTFSSNGVAPTVPTPTFNAIPPGGSLFNSANAISLNQFPDIIGKAAWDPTIADRTIHMEVYGIFRNFHDRVSFPFGRGFINQNSEVSAGSVGGSILVPIVPKVLEAYFSGLTGRGIGRYGASQLPDVTFNANGSLVPIQETIALAGVIWHAVPGLTLYAYAGEEYQNPSFGFTRLGANHQIGFGNPRFNNSGCEIEFSTVCTNNVKLVRQFTGGFWDDIYKGPYGRLSGGLQYSFTQKYGFPGFGFAPKRDENTFFTSLRYYPF
ncbi:MAG: hypothetical protein M3178_09440 [Pseudomonadota bacterium]|nr:hypothetical protein [Pseudomonadota bacterium]